MTSSTDHEIEINVGFVGYGLSTTAFHIPTVSAVPGANVYAVVQRAEAPAKSLGDETAKRGVHVTLDYPDVKHYRDATSMFQDEKLHVVVISTPSPGHYDMAKEALEAGKHVIVEKPFCPTYADCTSLISIAKSKNLLLTVYQNRRLDSDFLTLRKLLSSEPTSSLLNPIISVTSQFNRYRPSMETSSSTPKGWKNHDVPGNGILYDLGSHLIDQMVYQFGIPEWLWAHTDNQKQTEPLGIDDSFSLYLYYPAKEDFNGGKPLTVELKSSMISPVEKQSRWIVKGWNGTFKKYGLDVQEAQLRAFADEAREKEDYAMEPADEWPSATIAIDGLPLEQVNAAKQIFMGDIKTTGGFMTGKITPEKGDYIGYYQNAIGCVRRVVDGEGADVVTRDLLVKPEEARDVIGLIQLAKESSQSGNRIAVKERLAAM